MINMTLLGNRGGEGIDSDDALRSIARMIAYACLLAGDDALIRDLARGRDIWDIISDAVVILGDYGVDTHDIIPSMRELDKAAEILTEDRQARLETAMYANYMLHNVFMRRRRVRHR